MIACLFCPLGEIALGGAGLVAGGLTLLAVVRTRARAAVLKAIRGRKKTVKIEPECKCCDHREPS